MVLVPIGAVLLSAGYVQYRIRGGLSSREPRAPKTMLLSDLAVGALLIAAVGGQVTFAMRRNPQFHRTFREQARAGAQSRQQRQQRRRQSHEERAREDFNERVRQQRERMKGENWKREHARQQYQYKSNRNNSRPSTANPTSVHLRRLGLDPGKPLRKEAVKQAFKREAMKWHPDRLPHNDPQRIQYEARFKDISASYEFLLSVVTC